MPFHKTTGLRVRRWILQSRSSAYFRLNPEKTRFTVEKPGPKLVVKRLLTWVRSLMRRPKKPNRVLGGGRENRPPKGHLAVYVEGEEKGIVGPPLQRYVVPAVYFNHPLFGELLKEVEEEYGFNRPGGLRFPCSVFRFERIKQQIDCEFSGYKNGRRRCHRF